MPTLAVLAAATLAVASIPDAGGQERAPETEQDSLVDRGGELYAEGCISCHGPDGEGVTGTGPPIGAAGTRGGDPPERGAGPSLVGVGAASAHLYLTTGYMPLDDPHEAPERTDPPYDDDEIDALVAYVASLGPGPPIPDVDPERGNLAEGREAFTEYCAGCHQVVGEGGVTIDAVAPELNEATPTQVAEAIRIGPYVMPRFGEELIDDATVDSIARYVEYAKAPRDEGGWGIGHIGPIPEGLAAWLVAVLGLGVVARIIGKRIA